MNRRHEEAHKGLSRNGNKNKLGGYLEVSNSKGSGSNTTAIIA
jgi:hypothetical protein